MTAYLGLGVNVGLVLVHNRGVVGNAAQIAFVTNRTELRYFDTGVPDPDNPGQTIKRPYRVIIALARPHELVCFQVVPQGVARPANMDKIEPSFKVLYGPDQPSHTRRFFNWGLKRATDYGAEVVAFLDATGSFSAGDLDNSFDFAERTWGRIVKFRVQQRLGSGRRAVLNEALGMNAALADLRTRIDAEGLSRG